MRGGALRSLVCVQENVQVGVDDMNAPVYSWTTFAEIFCEHKARRGQEFFDPDTKQRYSQTIHEFFCRYYEAEGIHTSMRILFDGQYYDIRNVMPNENRHEFCVIQTTLQDGQVGAP